MTILGATSPPQFAIGESTQRRRRLAGDDDDLERLQTQSTRRKYWTRSPALPT